MSVVSLVDPARLSFQQRRAMRLIAQCKLYRRTGGYGRAPHSVRLDLYASLLALGLVRLDLKGFAPHPVLTGSGRNVLAVLDERAARRSA